MWITTNCGKYLRDENTRPSYLSSENLYARSNNYIQTWINGLVQNWEKSISRLYIVTLLYNLYSECLCVCFVTSLVSDSLWLHGLWHTRLLYPWDFPGKNTGVSCHNTWCESQVGWITCWNQDCQKNYQQSQICRWYHPNGRNWRGTEKPFDDSKIREWKSWFKTQHSKNKDHGIQAHDFMANRWGKNGKSNRLYFLGLQNHCRWWLKPCY